jgi:predicted  nucleic acid-binding Zn-ribbon protein
MSTVTAVLRECHRLRRHLRDLQAEIDRGPRVLKAQQNKLAAEEQAYKDAYEAIKKLKLKQKDDEGALKQTEQQLDKFERQLLEVATMKEIQAKKSEIEQAKAKRGHYEDAVLAAITEIEERTAKLPEVEQRWATAQKDFARYQVDAKERMERLLADQKACEADLVKADAALPVEVKGLYNRLVKTHGPDGLAAVVGRSCQQCRSSITEQQRLDLSAGRFLMCTQCGRGLYPAE